MRKPTFRKLYRKLTAAPLRQASRRAPTLDIPALKKSTAPAHHLTREEFDIAQSQGLLSTDWELHPTFIRMIVECYDEWPLVRVTFRIDTSHNVLIVDVREALTEHERRERGRKVKAVTHRFPQHSLKDTVEVAMTMAKRGMPVLTELVDCSGKLMPQKKIMDYKPGMWLMPFTNFNQFFKEHFNLVQVEPDIDDRVRKRFS